MIASLKEIRRKTYAAGASGVIRVTSGTVSSRSGLSHRHVQRARMRLVVEQGYRHGARVLHGLLGHGVWRVVILLAENRIDGRQGQAQTAALRDLARDEREVFEVVALRRLRRHEFWLAGVFAIAGTQAVARQRNGPPVGAYFRNAHLKIGVGLINGNPRRELEEAGDFRVLIEGRGVIDEVLAAPQIFRVLIGEV